MQKYDRDLRPTFDTVIKLLHVLRGHLCFICTSLIFTKHHKNRLYEIKLICTILTYLHNRGDNQWN